MAAPRGSRYPGPERPVQFGAPPHGYVPRTAPPAVAGDIVSRPVLFILVFLGGLLLWMSYLLLMVLDLDPGATGIVGALGVSGAFLGFLFSLLGGLAGRGLFPHQRLGFLLMAGAFILAATLLVVPFI